MKLGEIEIIDWQGRKPKYPYENLETIGGYYPVETSVRFGALNAAYQFLGRNGLSYKISLGKKEDMYVIIRVA